MDEPAHRNFDWASFLALASRLAEHSNDDASLRTAISRSYYAVYNRARHLLDHVDPDFQSHRTRESHKQVWDRVAALSMRQAKTLARSGKSLMHKRVDADYKDSVDGLPRQVEQALAEARRALNAIEDLLKP